MFVNMIPRHGQHRLKTGAAQAMEFLSRDHGLDLWLSRDFTVYSALTRPNKENCPYKIMPPFLPDWEGEGFWLEARDADDPVFAIAGRLCVGSKIDFTQWPGSWSATRPSALDGNALFNGGQWISPAKRGQSLSPLTCKLLHACALLLYDFDHIFALVVPDMHGGGDAIAEDSLSWRQGFRHCTPGITWTGYYPEPQHLSLIWMGRRQAIESLQG